MRDLSLQEVEFASQTTYTFVEEIGYGGMGIVYLAARNSGGVVDYVVLKTLKSLNDREISKLRHEANLAAALRHENIVKTYGVESIPVSALPSSFVEKVNNLSYLNVPVEERQKFRRLQVRSEDLESTSHLKQVENDEEKFLLVVMDYVDGMNLKELHQQHLSMSLLLPVQFGAFIISRIARALGYAHNYIIHRDISPENILVNTHGICKLGDFGVTAAIQKRPDYIAGRLTHMAPEQIAQRPVDERIDIFSLGAAAFEIATGIPILRTDSSLPLEEQKKMVNEQLKNEITPAHELREDIPEELSDILAKMLNPTKEFRYQRAVSVANHLEKNYLYSKGYGPTNNSLATYLSIFENRFGSYNEDQLENLSFLKNEKGDFQLQREISGFKGFTEKGKALLKERAPELYERLAGERVDTDRKQQEISWIKVKHLDNVIESFALEEKLTVGTAEDNLVPLTDEEIQPQHCCFQKQSDNTTIIEAIENAPIFINKTPVIRQELKEGDKITIGTHLFFFIKQKKAAAKTKAIGASIELQPDTEINAIPNPNKCRLIVKPTSQFIPVLTNLINHILASTFLSDLKKGVIPTALFEALQMVQGEDPEVALSLGIQRTPARLVFSCSQVPQEGYATLLSTVQKHRKLLLEELKETDKEDESSAGVDQDDIFSEDQDEIPEPPDVEEPKEDAEGEDEDEDDDEYDDEYDDEDFPDFPDDPDAWKEEARKLAVKMIVHGFDRIEFKQNTQEVELIVYL